MVTIWLRHLGYPVDAAPGAGGGYRLGVGAALPPLMLDDDEAVAVAIGLRVAAGGAAAGIEEGSARALAKLERLLPSRLRRRADALATTMAAPPVPDVASSYESVVRAIATQPGPLPG